MINAIKPRNGGIQLFSTNRISNDRFGNKVGWADNPIDICKLIEIDGGIHSFVHGYKIEESKAYGFATENGALDLWKEAVNLYREKTFTSDDN